MLERLEAWVNQAPEGHVRNFAIQYDNVDSTMLIWVFDGKTQVTITLTPTEIVDGWENSPKWAEALQVQLTQAEERLAYLQSVQAAE